MINVEAHAAHCSRMAKTPIYITYTYNSFSFFSSTANFLRPTSEVPLSGIKMEAVFCFAILVS